jgi:hypothetical protein
LLPFKKKTVFHIKKISIYCKKRADPICAETFQICIYEMFFFRKKIMYHVVSEMQLGFHNSEGTSNAISSWSGTAAAAVVAIHNSSCPRPNDTSPRRKYMCISACCISAIHQAENALGWMNRGANK